MAGGVLLLDRYGKRVGYITMKEARDRFSKGKVQHVSEHCVREHCVRELPDGFRWRIKRSGGKYGPEVLQAER
jgi:hypothetical protein